jgi:hypothetical protein
MPNKKKKTLRAEVKAVVSAMTARNAPMKKTRRRRRRNQTGNQSVALASGGNMRTYFKFSTRGDKLVLNGRELINEFKTSQWPRDSVGPVRVGYDDSTFPRLKALAALFQRYRFRRFTLEYVGLAPATRSGLCAAAVGQSFDQTALRNVSDYGAMQNNFVSPIWGNAKTPVYRYDGNEWWDIDDRLYATDPSKVAQLTMYGHVSGSVSADSDLLAGCVYAEYEIELEGLRPLELRGYMGTGLSDYQFAAAGTSFKVPARINGDNSLLRNSEEQRGVVPGDDDVDGAILAFNAAKWMYQWYFDCGAVETDDNDYHDVRQPAKKVQPKFSIAFRDQKDYEARKHLLKEAPPMAAGDVGLYLYGLDKDGQNAAIYFGQLSSGTGAISTQVTDIYDNSASAYESVYGYVTTTGAETRVVNVSKSFLEILPINDTYSFT